MTIDRILDEMQQIGATLRLDGKKVMLGFPEHECREKLAEHVSFLRMRREEVAELLRRRTHESDERCPVEYDQYAARMQRALAEINGAAFPTGMILCSIRHSENSTWN
jgi:hypothetical protein